MTDPTAGRSAGAPLNAEFDPMGRSDEQNLRSVPDAPGDAENDPMADPTAGLSAGTPSNVERDPTRPVRREVRR
jgi:hypothetical protein